MIIEKICSHYEGLLVSLHKETHIRIKKTNTSTIGTHGLL